MEPFDGKGTHQMNAGPNENPRIMMGWHSSKEAGVSVGCLQSGTLRPGQRGGGTGGRRCPGLSSGSST